MRLRHPLLALVAIFLAIVPTSAQFDEPEPAAPQGAKKPAKGKATPKAPRGKAKGKASAESAATTTTVVRLGKPVVHHWQVGVQVQTVDAPATGIHGTIPVPTEWPEQSVRLVKEKLSPSAKIDFVDSDDGIRRMTVSIGGMQKGDRAEALATFEIVKREVLPPDDTSRLRSPRDPRGEPKRWLAPGPLIESNHARIKALAAELVDGLDESDAWKRVETIFDGVRERCKVERRKPKGAFAALASGVADRDDMNALFVAVCRAARVPARMVWVVDDSYAEFLLEDESGGRHWIPCRPSHKEREFGFATSQAPILQRGDNFVVPEESEPVRFVREQFSLQAAAKPLVVFVRRLDKPPGEEDSESTDESP